MGNVSPRQSKSYHDGLAAHLALSSSSSAGTPNRTSWKKQLQMINDTLNIKKFSLRTTNNKSKRYRVPCNENSHHHYPMSTSQTFQDLTKMNPTDKSNKGRINKKLAIINDEQEHMHVKKSFSLFSMKQPLTDTTNKDITTTTSFVKDEPQEQSANSTTNVELPTTHKQPLNQVADILVQSRQRHKFETSTVSNTLVSKRHSAYVPHSYHLPKSQSQFYQHHLLLNSYGAFAAKNSTGNNVRTPVPLSAKHIRSTTATVTTTTRKTIIQASTSELLRCLGEYLCSRCAHLSPILDPIDCILWIKSADRQLILQGWQEQVFVNPANIVFVYLIVRETLTNVVPSTTITSVSQLHAVVLTCLYLAFSYMGNEITYPLKPFVTEAETRDVFWQRVVLLMGQLSAKMLAINQNPKFFTECFSELKTFTLVR